MHVSGYQVVPVTTYDSSEEDAEDSGDSDDVSGMGARFNSQTIVCVFFQKKTKKNNVSGIGARFNSKPIVCVFLQWNVCSID